MWNYFYKNNSDSYFKSFISQRTQAERTTFSIFKAKSDINFPDKNLDIFKYQMENLKENFNNLVKKTSEMDPVETMEYMTTLQSQPMYESKNEEESQQDQVEKNQNSSKSDIVSRHRIKYTATRIKYSPTRIKSRNFLSNI